jgi:membrane protein DedA with SNARE-associated domain
MELVPYWISHYGYAGIFVLLVLGIVGLPVPDETMLTLAGYLVFRGQLKAFPTAVAALGGTMCGITLSYVLGFTTGYYLLHRYGRRVRLTPEKIDRVHTWFKRVGGLTLTFGYFVPGVRHLTAYVAGASKLEYPVFAAFAYTGSLLWTTTFLALGYFLGENWPKGLSRERNVALVGCAVVLVLVLVWRLRERRLRKNG